jgi:cytochrome c553
MLRRVPLYLPNGLGHPESADLAGLPAEYFFQQVKDSRAASARTSFPHVRNGMVTIAKALTDDEIKSAAGYFAGLKPQRGSR